MTDRAKRFFGFQAGDVRAPLVLLPWLLGALIGVAALSAVEASPVVLGGLALFLSLVWREVARPLFRLAEAR
ncbi:MAG: hypothetical protein V2J26_11805 [Pacificimonas sp.]|jgi:hypothetical protein|nr:hypothetical protein [Pacificimonas sp.]